ncbi:hypothetical protein B0T10DRAFT_116313 [Thelonectria olida]|uniref:Uncharacterized protein n=1 Tax=Thelonectria olida TaxID=1576542 RepID=A0A9P8WGU8_9HYPO|nr:hypothetical protein B0T10DRAFT_116313 [Thelonectria olida]
MFKLFVQVNDRSCYSSHTPSSTTSIFRSRSFPSTANTNSSNSNTDISPSSTSTTMAKGRRPPPLNLSVDARPRSLPRISRTPVLLISKESTPLLTPLPEDDYEDPPEVIVRVVRIAVDFMHLVSCLMLVLIMTIFLATYSNALSWNCGPKAILLLSALVADIVLDVKSIRLHDRSWSEWTLLARTLAASAYLGVLIAFIIADRVFPSDYTYWNMSPAEAGGPVLALVCVVL